MVGKTTRLVIAASVCGIMFVVPPAYGGTVQQIMQDTLDGMTNPDPTTVWPLLFDDKDRTLVEDLDTGTDFYGNPNVTGVDGVLDLVGERIKGILQVQALDSGSKVDDEAKNVFVDTYTDGSLQNWGEGQLTTTFGSEGVELSGVFYLEATGLALNKFGTNWISFTSVANQALQTIVRDARGDTTVVEQDAVIALFEDSSPDFTTGGWATDVGNATDGTLWATVGFTPSDSTDTDFYYVHTSAEFLAFSLDFLTDTGPESVTYPGPIENEFGTTVAGTGSLDPGTSGYDKSSDADFKVLYVPVPPAVFGGLGLFGLGLLIRRRFF